MLSLCFILPGLWVSEELSTRLSAALDVFKNCVEFPEKLVVRKLSFCCLRLKHFQIISSCSLMTTWSYNVLLNFLAIKNDWNNVRNFQEWIDVWPILFPSSCSSASFTLLAHESKDSDRTFKRCNMANNSSRVYLYLQGEEMTENINTEVDVCYFSHLRIEQQPSS